MVQIITVTANTAFDLVIELEELCFRDDFKAKTCHQFVCGKGINVARAVASLNHPVTALGFVGKQSLHAFNEISSSLLQTDFIGVDGKTRTNITLYDSNDQREKHIRTSGFCVTEKECRQIKEKLATSLSAGDIVIFSGSLPAGAPEDFYQSLIELCHRHSAVPFLDSSGDSLSAGIEAGPFLIKPNLQELEEMSGSVLSDEQAVVHAARRLLGKGVNWIYVSRGEKGVIIVGESITLSACMKNLQHRIVSHVGCGDAMVAGLAVAELYGVGVKKAAEWALSCATANLFSVEPGRFDRKLQIELLAHCHIQAI